jgi:hypothetical protein
MVTIPWKSLVFALAFASAATTAIASSPGGVDCPRVRVRSTPAGILLDVRGLADVVARARTAQFVELEWTDQPGRVAHVRLDTLLEHAQLDLARRLMLQPISARHLIFAGERRLIEQSIGRALVGAIRRMGEEPARRLDKPCSIGTGPQPS